MSHLKRIDYSRFDSVVNSKIHLFHESLDRWFPQNPVDIYITGSIALKDFQPDRSDIDFVCVSENPWEEGSLVRLQQMHREIRQRQKKPALDGVYFTYDDLQRTPKDVRGPFCSSGRFDPARTIPADPVTWTYLNTCALVVRGRHRLSASISDEEMRAWCRGNIRKYWLRWADRVERDLWYSIYGLTRPAASWGVSGIARLHTTIFTGKIISKTASFPYARQEFDHQWSSLIDEAESYRLNKETERRLSPLERRRLLIGFVRYVAELCLD